MVNTQQAVVAPAGEDWATNLYVAQFRTGQRGSVIGSEGEVECGRAGRMWKKEGFGQQHKMLLTFLKRKESKSRCIWWYGGHLLPCQCGRGHRISGECGWIGNGAVRDLGESLRCKEGMKHMLELGETRCVDWGDELMGETIDTVREKDDVPRQA